MLLAQGVRVIAVAFDYWGLASMVSKAVKDAREVVAKSGEETNGEGAEKANGAGK